MFYSTSPVITALYDHFDHADLSICTRQKNKRPESRTSGRDNAEYVYCQRILTKFSVSIAMASSSFVGMTSVRTREP